MFVRLFRTCIQGGFISTVHVKIRITMSKTNEYWLDYIEANRSKPGKYVLNGKDRTYCVTGQKQGSLKKSELRSRITNDRLQKLPQRFQDLFDDLALVEYSDTDFLSDSEENEIWREVLDRSNTTRPLVARRPSSGRIPSRLARLHLAAVLL